MFDMDGLLVDTEPLWFEAEREIMARLGGAWTHADQAELVGGSLAKSLIYMLARAAPVPPNGVPHPSRWPPDETTVGGWLVDSITGLIAARGARLMPGAAELLAEVTQAGLPCALVTSSQRPVMDAVLRHLARTGGGPAPGARQSGPFDVTVCAADVAQTKPHPEPYLLAAELLGADPASCVVLEDSPNGVAAAEAAGCVVVAVPGVAPVPLRQGRIVVPSLREVSAGWLRHLVASRHAPR
jgi:beta-phosphoglucomutase-like phosphatase (HAD superfamily)